MLTRSGFDAYGLCLLCVFFLLRTLVRMTHLLPLMFLGYAVLLYALFRIFSSKVERRRMENARFLLAFTSFSRWLKWRRTMRQDKEHRYFTCPNCHQPLRVPRGKGRIDVHCRSCGTHFEAKS